MKNLYYYYSLIVVLGLVLVSQALYSQSKEILHTRSLPFPEFQSKTGQYTHPKVSKGNTNWMSYEIQSEIGTRLFIGHLGGNKSHEIKTLTEDSNDEGAFSSAANTGTIESANELEWCPVTIEFGNFEESVWFVFVSSGGLSGNKELYLVSVDDLSRFYRLTNNRAVDFRPKWSPDGMSLTYVSSKSGATDIYLIRDVWGMVTRLDEEMRDGNRNVGGDNIDNGKWSERLTTTPEEDNWHSWSPDGKYILYSTLKSAGEGKSMNRLSSVDIEKKQSKVLLSDKKMVMMNGVMSPNQKSVAFYRSGDPKEIKANLVVASLTLNSDGPDTLKPMWTNENVRKFKDVQCDIEQGPVWTSEGNLLFVNQINGEVNYIYEVPERAFMNMETIPELLSTIITYEQSSEKISIDQIDLLENEQGNGNYFVAGILGDKFGIYTDIINVPSWISRPRKTGTTIVGLSSSFYQMVGNVNTIDMGTGTELYCQTPVDVFNSKNYSLYIGLGQGYIQGSNVDDNNESHNFISTLYYGIVMPGYKVPLTKKLSFSLRAGLGVLKVGSKNSETDGLTVVVPAGAQLEYQLFSSLIVSAQLKYMIVGSDLDGLKRKGNPQYEKDSILNFTIGFGLLSLFNH